MPYIALLFRYSSLGGRGTDRRYIQELLIHKSSKTTEIYIHVSNKDIGKIKSLLDTIIKGGGNRERDSSTRVVDKRNSSD